MEMNAIQIFQTITAGGVLTTAATNLLNSPIVRIPFEKNKRLTAFMVSVVVTLAALYQQTYPLSMSLTPLRRLTSDNDSFS